jgi:uncharacterized peroxidase-related enzyme
MKMIEPDHATGELAAAYQEATRQFGGVINLFRSAGNAPNVLSGILAMNRELGSNRELTDVQVEQVAMLVSALNRCDYCVNVHMQVGKASGLTVDQMLEAMRGAAEDEETQALLDYTGQIVRHRGMVSEEVLSRVRDRGFSDKALLEVIGVVGIYTTLQYIRHVANPEQDFPAVTAFDPDLHGA